MDWKTLEVILFIPIPWLVYLGGMSLLGRIFTGHWKMQ